MGGNDPVRCYQSEAILRANGIYCSSVDDLLWITEFTDLGGGMVEIDKLYLVRFTSSPPEPAVEATDKIRLGPIDKTTQLYRLGCSQSPELRNAVNLIPNAKLVPDSDLIPSRYPL
jgi:hypothetical protein